MTWNEAPGADGKAMATMKLRLGKGSSFVKSRLQRYPQEDDVWEADFQPIPDEEKGEFWLGIVINQEIGVELAHQVLDAPPTVNDLARILADAIQRPIVEGGGGLVFEDTEARTLDEAMTALERGIAEQCDDL